MKKYSRKCPECKMNIYYTNKYNLKNADLNDTHCLSCCSLGKCWV